MKTAHAGGYKPHEVLGKLRVTDMQFKLASTLLLENWKDLDGIAFRADKTKQLHSL